MRKNKKRTCHADGSASECGIGTLNESSLHSQLKRYIDSDESHWEIKSGHSVCDIINGDGIFEVQTGNFYSIRRKLKVLLSENTVTLVYPIISEKRLFWVDTQTGERTGGRKSPRHDNSWCVFRELSSIQELLDNENLRIRLVTISVDEYKYLNGWSEDRKKGASRMDRVLTGVIADVIFTTSAELIRLLPEALDENFTSKDAANAVGLAGKRAAGGLKVLNDLGLISRIGRDKRGYIYKRGVKNEKRNDCMPVLFP